MNNYELVVVLDGKATASKKKTVTESLTKLVKSTKGELGKVKDWGVKDLSYRIKKSTTGAYLIFPLELDGNGAKEVSNKLRLEDDLNRYLLIRK